MISSENIYLLGAGFSKAICPKIPLNNDLLGAIMGGNAEKLSAYHKKYMTEDIERLLTQIDLDGFADENCRKDRQVIQSEISSFFSSYRFSALNGAIPAWLERFSKEILKENDSIVSLNYDCMLEGTLDYFGVWTPKGGYARIDAFPTESILPNPKQLIIHKIHGSENFREAGVIGRNRNQTAIGFHIDESIYPKSGANSHLGFGGLHAKPYIIAPSFVKIPHADIAAMMLDLLDIARNAKRLAIIGCGMRPEDNFLWFLVTRFLNVSREDRKILVILGPSSGDIWERLSNFWVGDICRFTTVSVIPCGLEDGLSSLEAAMKA